MALSDEPHRGGNVPSTMAFLAGTTPLQAQRYNFKFYGQEEGLQNLAVQVVLQDREGFLWVGTQNGLFRYDGSGFKAFTRDDGLPGARIESMHEAADGSCKGGHYNRPSASQRAKNSSLRRWVTARMIVGREGITSDPQGRVYLATERGLLAGTSKGNGAQGGIVQFTPVGSVDHPAEAVSVYLTGPESFGMAAGWTCALWKTEAPARWAAKWVCRRDAGTRSWKVRTALSGCAARKASTCVLAVRIDSRSSWCGEPRAAPNRPFCLDFVGAAPGSHQRWIGAPDSARVGDTHGG